MPKRLVVLENVLSSETVECGQRMAVQNKGAKEVEHNSRIYPFVNWFSSGL